MDDAMRQHYVSRLRHVADDLERRRAGALGSHTPLEPHEMRAIADALSAPTWLPIQAEMTPGVAPWDGEEWLLFRAEDEKVFMGWFIPDVPDPWWSANEGMSLDGENPPTHYAPLPARPREAAR